jgi:hypothetical protein
MDRLIAIALSCVLCQSAAAEPETLTVFDMREPAPLSEGVRQESAGFGGDFDGRALWLSANGRFAAIFRVTDDTNRNGRLDISFGQHGDSWGDELALDMFDIETGKHRRFDDLLSGDPRGKFAVLRRGRKTFLFDSANGGTRNLRELGGGALSDANPCMSPRQIEFDPWSDRIALLRDEPAQLIIHSTHTGSSRVIYRSENPLWRIRFTADPSWLIAIETTEGFPEEHTSCVSRSRLGFALSTSSIGFESGPLGYALLNENGQRIPLEGDVMVLSGAAYGNPGVGQLLRFDGGAVGIPPGCRLAGGAEGSRVVVLGCENGTELFDPATGRRRALPTGLSLRFLQGVRATGPDGTWYAIAMPIPNTAPKSNVHLGRLRLEDLRLERGPEMSYFEETGNPDWLAAVQREDYFLLHVAAGTLLKTRVQDSEIRANGFALGAGDDVFLLLDPDSRTQIRVARRIRAANGHGCFIIAHGERPAGRASIDRGPWKRICSVRP